MRGHSNFENETEKCQGKKGKIDSNKLYEALEKYKNAQEKNYIKIRLSKQMNPHQGQLSQPTVSKSTTNLEFKQEQGNSKRINETETSKFIRSILMNLATLFESLNNNFQELQSLIGMKFKMSTGNITTEIHPSSERDVVFLFFEFKSLDENSKQVLL